MQVTDVYSPEHDSNEIKFSILCHFVVAVVVVVSFFFLVETNFDFTSANVFLFSEFVVTDHAHGTFDCDVSLSLSLTLSHDKISNIDKTASHRVPSQFTCSTFHLLLFFPSFFSSFLLFLVLRVVLISRQTQTRLSMVCAFVVGVSEKFSMSPVLMHL